MSTHIHDIMLTSTDIHHSSCSHTGHVYTHPQFIMFTLTDIHNSSCSHTDHVYTHPQHHVHIDRHPPCIMFTHWPHLQTSRNTKYPQLPDQNCSPFHILTNRFTFQVHYPGGMKMTRTNMRSVTLCHAFRQQHVPPLSLSYTLLQEPNTHSK